MTILVPVVSAGLAAALLMRPGRPAQLIRSARQPLEVLGRPGMAPQPVGSGRVDDRGWLLRGRVVWAVLGAVAVAVFVGGPVGWGAAPVAAVGVWVLCTRAEPPQRRRAREAARRDLPHLVGLVGDGLRSGRAAVDALALAAAALPGPAADRLAFVLPRLRLGVDPGSVWSDLARERDLGPLGRALGRAHESGAAAGSSIDRLAIELARTARADVEDRARAVGVRAAVPLMLCLLPSFILLGIVPVVAGLLTGLGL